MMTIFLSLVAPESMDMTTYGAASGGILITLCVFFIVREFDT